jgi:antitoxin component YwqK of YwqJK toxin-antitoxin module
MLPREIYYLIISQTSDPHSLKSLALSCKLFWEFIRGNLEKYKDKYKSLVIDVGCYCQYWILPNRNIHGLKEYYDPQGVFILNANEDEIKVNLGAGRIIYGKTTEKIQWNEVYISEVRKLYSLSREDKTILMDFLVKVPLTKHFVTYKDGIKEGPAIKPRSDGIGANGVEECFYRSGKREGPFKYVMKFPIPGWPPATSTITGNFHQGQMHGKVLTLWSHLPHPFIEENYHMGKLNGKSFTYALDGSIAASRSYCQGQMNGTCKTFCGEKATSTCTWQNGKKISPLILYNPDGSIKEVIS